MSTIRELFPLRRYLAAFPVLCALVSLFLAAGPREAAAALPPPAPEPNPLADRIVEITPLQAMPGQTITIRTAPVVMKSALPPGPFKPLTSIAGLLGPPRVYFGNSYHQQHVLAQSMTALGDGRYRVVVPEHAHTSTLRLQTFRGNSYSSDIFTVNRPGYRVRNFSQYYVISFKVDGAERILLDFVRPDAPNIPEDHADFDVPAGSHSVQVTLGVSTPNQPWQKDPVIVYSVTATATYPLNVIDVGIMGLGEYLTASPNAVVSGTTRVSSWQTLVIGPGNAVSVNGFDFALNTATGVTTWTHWVGDRPNISASGTLSEPAAWPSSPASLNFQLRRSNGSLFTNVLLDFVQARLTADDGALYELQ